MDRFRNGTRAALIAAAAGLLAACGGSDDDDNGGADRVTAQEACTALSGKTQQPRVIEASVVERPSGVATSTFTAPSETPIQ